MGYIVPGICQTRKVGSPTQKAVLMALASYAWDDGSSIWVAKATLAADLEMGHRTVQDAIKALIAKGLLIEVGQREIKHGFTVEYRIDLEAVETLPLTRDPRKKSYKNGCGSRIRSDKTPAAAAQTGAGDCKEGCGSRTQLSKEYITKSSSVAGATDEKKKEPFESFYTDLLQALGVTEKGWWAGKKGRDHVRRWLASGLTEDQVLSLARRNREAHDALPEGPKALDAAMDRAATAASAPAAPAPASPEDRLAFWADKIRNAPFVAASSVKVGDANEMLRRGLVTVDQLRRWSIAFTAAPAARRTAA